MNLEENKKDPALVRNLSTLSKENTADLFPPKNNQRQKSPNRFRVTKGRERKKKKSKSLHYGSW